MSAVDRCRLDRNPLYAAVSPAPVGRGPLRRSLRAQGPLPLEALGRVDSIRIVEVSA